jgi:riboflavin biosynthesis pyrimidine reductase
MISSLDGAATLAGRSGTLGSPADKDLMVGLRSLADVVLVGAGTVRVEGYRGSLIDDSARRARLADGLPEHPRVAVISGSLDLDPGFFDDAPVRPILITHAGAPDRFRDRADVLVCGESVIDVAVMLAELTALGLTQVLCEGGPHVTGVLTAADAIDELCLSLSPQLVGPGPVRITDGPASPPRRMRLAHVLTDSELLFLRHVRA